MKLNHPLMHNNFSNSDMNAVRKLITFQPYDKAFSFNFPTMLLNK